MTRFDARTSGQVVVLLVLAALPLSSSTGRASAPPVVPVTLVNPTVGDCYSGAGCLDPSFGAGAGKVMLDVGGIVPQYGYAAAVQPDGKTLVAGASLYHSNPNGWDWVIARFDADGTVDSGFGNAGIVRTHYLSGPGGPPATGSLEQARAIAVQSDGKIVVAGWGSTGGTGYTAVLRLNGADGSPDLAFGSGGTVMVSSLGTNVLMAMKIQPADGKILLASGSTVVRLKTTGFVDTTFGSKGYRSVGPNCTANSLALQSNGKIVVAGNYSSGSTGADFSICRLTSSGAVDSSFGSNGKRTVDFFGQYDTVWSVAVAADDSIVAEGYVYQTSAATNLKMAFARFTPSGAVSTSFGTTGKVVLDMFGSTNYARGVVIQPDGKIVFAGSAHVLDESDGFGIVGRLTASGALDTTFGTGGVTATAFDINAGFLALAVGSNGITAAGFEYTQSDVDPNHVNPNKLLVARYIQ